MNRNNHGFTVIEIVVVLVLISIIAATVFGRSITTDQINFVGQAAKITSHVRYAKSMAMKRNETWGVFKNGTEYWMFQGDEGGLMNKQVLPGQESNTVSLSDLGLTMTNITLFFDGTGKPYTTTLTNPLISDLEIKIQTEDLSKLKSFYITPETGLVRD